MYKKFVKRVIDIVVSIVLIFFFIPCYVVVGIAIKLEDGGPIFFCGERLGKGLTKYKMYKFRSMIDNSPDIRNEDGSTFNSNLDSRLTRVGRIIRKLSIDEIPQIINVIKGDMSLIGPRPSPCGNTHLYTEEYLRKFDVKPGITGYAQAYYRNAATLEEKRKYDLYYIEYISFMLDLNIILKTIYTVFKRRGVYTNQTSGKEINM